MRPLVKDTGTAMAVESRQLPRRIYLCPTPDVRWEAPSLYVADAASSVWRKAHELKGNALRSFASKHISD